jgi:cysteine desulfurase
MGRIYFDHNASSPLRPEARAAMLSALEAGGNPSSVHTEGRKARAVIENARETVAGLMGVRLEDVIFTSGGTEAANTLLQPLGDGATLLLGATEHPCVAHGHRFAAGRVRELEVDADGVADLAGLERLLDESGTRTVVAIQAANNETGVLQPFEKIAALTRAAGASFICDAVQMAGRLPLDAASLGADAFTLSAHKFGGPKGIGAIILSAGGMQVEPLIRGGKQERGTRHGTENVPGVAGMAAALEAAVTNIKSTSAAMLELRNRLEAGLKRISPDAVIIGEAAWRLPNTVLFAVPGLSSETLLMSFDLAGVALSAGSACSSGKIARSPVLAAMKVPDELAAAALRVSLGWTTAAADVEEFLGIWQTVYSRLKGRAAA